MKKKYLYLSLIFVTAFNLSSCSEDETPTYPEEKDQVVEVPESSEITVDKETLSIIKGQSQNLEITEGAGDYKALVLDKTIAETSLEGNTVTVKALAQGNTEFIISDKGGAYKNIKVEVYLTDNIQTSLSELNMALPFGKPSESFFTMTEGNGGYTATSSNEEVATVSISASEPDKVVVSAVKEGQTEITVTDVHGLSAKVTVNVTVSDSPFTQEQLEAIKADETVKYMVGSEDYLSLIDTAKRVYHNGQSKDFTTNFMTYYYACGIEWMGNQQHMLIVQFDNKVSLDLGKKEGGKLVIKKNRKFICSNVPCTFEIIKHENGKVWAIYYAQLENEDVISGYMIFEE